MGKVSILMYHQVGRFPPMREHRANYCDHRRFRRQMAWLRRAGYPVWSMDRVASWLRGELDLQGHAVALTFDDGYQNFVEYALPVLRACGFPATVYVISDWLGRQTEWFAKDPGRPLADLMDARQILALRDQGITIGSHGCNHLKLAEQDVPTQRRELQASKQFLEDLLGEPVRHLCYPFGSFNDDTVALAAEAGYDTAVSCIRGAALSEDHPLVLPRKAISFGDSLAGFWWKLAVKQAAKPVLSRWRGRAAGNAG
jgi:peptidoglycan/xylan/chitin deacetylase (PgdA/CDA1 family)